MAASFPKTVDFLQRYLADLSVTYQKLRSYHWNVEGPAFYTLHAKLEELYDAVAEEVDAVAERILMLGDRPLSTLREYLEKTEVAEAPARGYQGAEIARDLIGVFSYLAASLRKGIEVSEKEGDAGTMDMLTQSLEVYEKNLWMLRAFVQT